MSERSNLMNTAILAGGVDFKVTLTGGATEEVFVRALPIKRYPALLAAIDDESRQVEIFCDKPAGWAETLTPQSHNEVMKAGEEINKEPFFDWSARRMERARRAAPQLVEKIMTEAIASALKTSLPTPPSAAV